MRGLSLFVLLVKNSLEIIRFVPNFLIFQEFTRAQGKEQNRDRPRLLTYFGASRDRPDFF